MLRDTIRESQETATPMMPSVDPKVEAVGDEADKMVACGGCGDVISDRFYLRAIDKEWHASCLRCCECKVTLDSNATCFARDGNVYCKEDYYRRFAMKKCARCSLDISSRELVMKARQFVYHLHCFCCASCHKLLSTGEYYGMRDHVLFCKTHYEQSDLDLPSRPESPPPTVLGGQDFCGGVGGGGSKQQQLHQDFMEFSTNHGMGMRMGSGTPGGGNCGMPPGGMMMDGLPLPPGMQPMGGGLHVPSGHLGAPPPPFYNGVGSTQKGRPRKRKSQNLDLLIGDGDEMTMTSDGLMLTSTRQKRIRTSFKHQQLRVLKSYFSLNQNPDAKDLKQLAQKTGLAKRVLQVWFQNARAKYRRNMLKQQSDPSSNNNKNSSSSNESNEFSPNNNNNQSMDSSEFPEIPDIRNSHSPTAMSDLSSTPSLSDLHPGGQIGREAPHETGSNFTDLFSHVTSSMNGFL